MNSAPEGFTDAQWHQEAIADTGVDHTRHPRQYVIRCEWCPHIVIAHTYREAMAEFQKHRDATYGDYLDQGVAAGRFPDPRLPEPIDSTNGAVR